MTERSEISPKMLLLYQAVIELLTEGVDVNTLKISEITQKAGIGKGTAYDYFQSKEEVIGKGVIYYMNQFLKEAEEDIKELPTFQEGASYLFDLLERNLNERGCLLQVVHLFFGSSQVSEYLRKAVENKEALLPMYVLDKMVESAKAKGEIKPGYPSAYIVSTMCARYLTYAAVLDAREEDRAMYSMKVDKKEFRELIFQGIMQEFAA